jgi:hypothetical protein
MLRAFCQYNKFICNKYFHSSSVSAHSHGDNIPIQAPFTRQLTNPKKQFMITVCWS